jgi:hypothetical protein
MTTSFAPPLSRSPCLLPEACAATNAEAAVDSYVLWIDGAGAHGVCLAEAVSIGGPAGDADAADIALLANLSRRHAVFRRTGERYVLEPLGPTKLHGRLLECPAPLTDGTVVTLGESVQVRFRLPSPLSASAVLEFASDHRPVQRIDSVVLMDENCLLGPGRSHHVDCRSWSGPVVVFRRDGGFRCRARTELWIDGAPSGTEAAFAPGAVVTCGEGAWRLERVADAAGRGRHGSPSTGGPR